MPKIDQSLATLLNNSKAKRMVEPTKEPLWKGPEKDGVTYSLLCRWLEDKERFRLYAIEGYSAAEGFNHYLEYGNMWHICEEYHAKRQDWEKPLLAHTKQLAKRFPFDQADIEKWYQCCKVQFPCYVSYWAKHPDVVKSTPLLQEYTFCVPHTLPNGRVVKLRGKMDSVDLVNTNQVWLQENKSKSKVEYRSITHQLKFDLQTMMYVVALQELLQQTKFLINLVVTKSLPTKKALQLAGVRYNVIRRPLSGGVGSIVQHKATKKKQAETAEAFYTRLKAVIAAQGNKFFYRWNVAITPKDVAVFKHTCLDPMLMALCEWYDHIDHCKAFELDPFEEHGLHWRHPYGVRNLVNDGGTTDLDELLDTGSVVGLTRVDTLFPELQ